MSQSLARMCPSGRTTSSSDVRSDDQVHPSVTLAGLTVIRRVKVKDARLVNVGGRLKLGRGNADFRDKFFDFEISRGSEG